MLQACDVAEQVEVGAGPETMPVRSNCARARGQDMKKGFVVAGKVACLLMLTAPGRAYCQAGGLPPSPRELNGFLIGQHMNAIASSLSRLLLSDTTSDGWIENTYLLNRGHRAYMGFKFSPDHKDQTVSVQVAGDSGTLMLSFLGLQLGDHSAVLRKRLGPPARIDHDSTLKLDLYSYTERNYSFEVDAHDRISSILIFGDDGIPQGVPASELSMSAFASALKAGPAAALEWMAPDVEIFVGDSTFEFDRGALREMQDSTSRMARLLLRGPRSLASLLSKPSVVAKGEIIARVYTEHEPNVVWKAPASSPLQEIVFTRDFGRWRAWEIRFR